MALKAFALSGAATVVVCALIAVALATLVPAVGGLHVAWVNSICIGMSANILINSGRHAIWRRREPSAAGMIALSLSSVVLSIWLGGQAAAAILGTPADWLTDNTGGVRIAALVATLGGTTAIAGVIWIRQYTASLKLRTQLEQTRADAAARLADEAQLRMLRAQLEPHMLFNTLATLRALISIDPSRAQDMVDHLVGFMRSTLGASQNDRISLDTEFRLLDNYLSLMAVRMGQRLTYQIELPPQLASLPVPPMLVQPLVENAVRHGLEPSPQGGHVRIRARMQGDMLEVCVTDSGMGFPVIMGTEEARRTDAGAGVQPSGFGLGAVRSRLRAAYAQKASMSIQSPYPAGSPGGTRVTLILPLPAAFVSART